MIIPSPGTAALEHPGVEMFCNGRRLRLKNICVAPRQLLPSWHLHIDNGVFYPHKWERKISKQSAYKDWVSLPCQEQNMQVTWSVNNLLLHFPFSGNRTFTFWIQILKPWIFTGCIDSRCNIYFCQFQCIGENMIMINSRVVWLWKQLIWREGRPLPDLQHSCETSVTPAFLYLQDFQERYFEMNISRRALAWLLTVG